ncbi:hypothetical protein QR680_002236 [Steinernema hermaphroditum]|uniref:Uncharacterized protein n=1 Tax=Steinernema hermaphroditum TaxID=289476 RepID=A0AA39LHU9_9BILA|nr:hypothetical protein QR680_002236 [Steinernema hermaphroditum]
MDVVDGDGYALSSCPLELRCSIMQARECAVRTDRCCWALASRDPRRTTDPPTEMDTTDANETNGNAVVAVRNQRSKGGLWLDFADRFCHHCRITKRSSSNDACLPTTNDCLMAFSTLTRLKQKLRFTIFIPVFLVFAACTVQADSHVPGAPIIVEHPVDSLVLKESAVTLGCKAKGDNVKITWYKDKKPFHIDSRDGHRILLPTGSLILLKFNTGGKNSDEGTYFCEASNEFGSVRSQEADVRSAVLKDEFKVRPKGLQVIVGSRAVLECSPPEGYPQPTVIWQKDERELRIQDDDRMTIHGGNIVIDPVQRSDGGFYKCLAINMVGERESNPVKLSVLEKPHFVVEPKDLVAEVGSSVSFDCRVSGDPSPTILWKKHNENMPIGRSYIAPDNSALRIDRIEQSDEGEYVCSAKNSAGVIESSARLKVHAQPKFTKTPADVNVNLGSTAIFDCSATGQPEPAVFWSREGEQEFTFFAGRNSPDGRIKVSSEGQLVIGDVRTSDEGNYVCAAMNSAGSTLAKATLKIANKGKSPLRLTTTLSLSCFYNASLCINGTDPQGQGAIINPPPIIQHGHANQTLMLGSTAILPCQATGRIPPHISWLRNGRPMSFDLYGGRYQQLNTGSLQISDLQKSDTDVYTCRAKNVDGEATWTASLTVEGHSDPSTVFSRMSDTSAFPSAPGRPSVLNYTDDSIELEWSAPEKQGVNPVSGYILQYYSPEMGETWNNVHDYISGTRFRVKHLKAGNTYVFVVRAENSKGIGPPSLVSPVVRTKSSSLHFDHYASPDLDTVRQRLGSQQLIRLEEVKIINSTAVRIIWKLRRNEPLIEGYSVRWRGPPLSNDAQWVNVTDGLTDSVVINGFKPFTHYEFFVIPYHRTVSGMPSNTLSGYTDEAPPSAPPSDVRIRMMNLTTLRISWRPPPADGINGILKGFEIIILGDGVKFNRNITTNERAASVTLFHLITGMTYRVRVAAKTGAGTGVYHGTDSVTMDEMTLKKHLEANDGRGGQFWYYLTQPWVIALIAVFLWAILVALIVLVFLRYKKHKSSGKDSARGHNPFIRINDGSVHTGPRDTFWMDPVSYNNMNQNTLMREQCIPQLYTKTPNQNDFIINGKVHMGSHGQLMDYAIANTMERASSPHHYHYAALPDVNAANNMSTFYGRQFHDDPSPYATTTLVMNNHQNQKWLTDHMLRGPVLPSKPIPPGPPVSFSNDHHVGCHTMSAASRRAMHNHAPSHHSHSDLTVGRLKNQVPVSDSPPHTDVSYVQLQSSDGTGGSSGRGKEAMGSWDRRSPPKPNLMDMIPPPPPGAPPIVDSDIYAIDGAAENEDHYDSVSESLLYAPNNSCGSHSRLPNVNQENGRLATSKNSRPTSRSRAGPRDTRLTGEDNDSQRSSLMMDDEGRAADFDSEFENDVSDAENSHPVKKSQHAPYSASEQSPMSRPAQPCMGVRSSTLVQNSYDPVASKRSTTRLKSLPRNSRKDMV